MLSWCSALMFLGKDKLLPKKFPLISHDINWVCMRMLPWLLVVKPLLLQVWTNVAAQRKQDLDTCEMVVALFEFFCQSWVNTRSPLKWLFWGEIFLQNPGMCWLSWHNGWTYCVLGIVKITEGDSLDLKMSVTTAD